MLFIITAVGTWNPTETCLPPVILLKCIQPIEDSVQTSVSVVTKNWTIVLCWFCHSVKVFEPLYFVSDGVIAYWIWNQFVCKRDFYTYEF
jgi:hypothetical protein